MADNNRNYRGEYDTSNQDRDENKNYQKRDWERGRRDENRGYGNSRYDQQYDPANNNRWNESRYDQGDSFNRHDQDQDRNYGYGGREYGSSYGGGLYQGNNSYYDSGSNRNERPSYGSSRNLYDRDYEGFNRGFNSGYSGLGGANYGSNDRSGREGYNQNRSYNDRSQFSGNYYGSGRGGYSQGDTNERSWWDRTRDEVSSWFGDEDAERRRERDSQMNFRGKGPRNYSRSDDRIKEDINDRLSDDPWVDASDIEITVSNAEVTITGTVKERSEKRRAEDLAEAVSGVKHVENRLRVGKQQESKIGTGSSIGNGSTSYGADTSAVPSGKSSK
jgi:osmotically-inducible protein OsmY